MAGIQAQLVPVALAQGWTLVERMPARKGNTRLGEFQFARTGPGLIHLMGIDFLYGERPDVWVSGVSTIGSTEVCTDRCNFDCVVDVHWGKASYLRLARSLLRRKPRRSMPEALERGLRCLEIVDGFLQAGTPHPDLLITVSRPPYEWPEGYEDLIK